MPIDNDFVDGQFNAANEFLPVNPYADKENAIVMRGLKSDCCNYLASFGYTIPAGGATTSITPLTGNLGSKLRFYRVEITDGKNTVTGQLNLAARTTPFVLNTSILDPTAEWIIGFYGSEKDGFGSADCPLSYKIVLCCGAVVAGVQGTSIPKDWVNVQAILKLTSTDDANFTLFPANGLVVDGQSVVNLVDYLSSGTQLGSGSSYLFSLELKKIGLEPTVPFAPTPSTSDVFTFWTNTATYPFTILTTPTQVLVALSIKTSAAGQFSEAMTFLLNNEGVTPYFSFTVATNVA